MSIELPSIDPVEDTFTGHRQEIDRVDLLTNVDGVLGELDGVEECSLVLDADALIGGAGSMTLRDTGQNVDWPSMRVQPWVQVNGESWPLGIFLLAAPDTDYTGTGRGWSVTLTDKVSILESDPLVETLSFPAGAVITDAVVSVINGAGVTRTKITASSGTLSEPGLTWPVGTSRLAVVNDLLKALNYSTLRADGYGYLYSGPVVPPVDRPVTWEFIEGDTAIHSAEFTVKRELSTIPNRVVCTWQASAETEVQKAVAEDLDPDSPTSYPNRGRWVTKIYENEEADSQETLDAIAEKYLRDAVAPADGVVFQHAKVPLTIGDVVRFRSADLDMIGEVRRTEAILGVGALTRTTIRKVVNDG